MWPIYVNSIKHVRLERRPHNPVQSSERVRDIGGSVTVLWKDTSSETGTYNMCP